MGGFFLTALLVTVLRVSAQAPIEAASTVITGAGVFWNIPEADRHKPHPVRMELLVFYHDAGWKLLYGQTGTEVSYLPTKGRALPLKGGQKVRLEGTVVPAEGFDGDLIRTTLLDEDQLPDPLPAAGRMADAAGLNGRWVSLEGYVLSQTEPDLTHVVSRVWSEGQMLTMTVQISGTEPVPQLVGARIRAQGVYDVALDAEGKIQSIDFWSGEPDRIELLGWLADEPFFRLPRTPIERLEQAAAEPWVRITGEVQGHDPGERLIVRDETGQVEIATAQPGDLPAGVMVEVIGRAVPAGLGWTLHRPLFRRIDAAADTGHRAGPGNAPMRLRLADQVLQLTPAEAAAGYPVTLRGVVTWSDENTDRFYVQDVSGGVLARRSAGILPGFGTSVTVMGTTVRGMVRPEVVMTDVFQAGTLTLPPPRRITLEQALTGAEEGRWVEMAGYVRQVVPRDGRVRLDLTAATGEFSVELPPDDSLAGLQGAMVRVRGVCVARPAASGELSDIRVWAQNREALSIDTPASADPFQNSLQSIAALRQFSSGQPANRRVRVRGVVSLHRPGRHLFLQDGPAGLFVLTREAGDLAPGTAVEVVGVLGRVGNRLALREGAWRKVAEGPPIEPHPLPTAEPVDPALDIRLVRLPAILRQAVRTDDGWQLLLESGGRIFESTLPAATDWKPPAAGSRLELTGVHVVEFDEYRQPHGIKLELRDPADIRLLARPPWWDVRRTLYVAGGLGVLVLLILSWGITLRHRVQAQTEQIRLQAEQEKRLQAELERSTRLESLGVLAGGIAHDFNNLLTAILGNLGLAAMDKRVMAAAGDCIAEAERGARRARDITQQLLTFAKGGDPVRTAVSLPEIVTEAANFARHGSNVRFDYDFPSNLPPGDVDAGQVSRVVHNLVINAVQAMPQGGVVSLALAAVEVGSGEVDTLAPGAYLRLTIADTGKGIPAENLARVFDPYFSTKAKAGNSGLGLATVRSIVKKHSGHIEVDSLVGRGTTFRIWLPAAPHEMPADQADPPGVAVHGSARILVMDDEEVIRRVAGRMLALAGHETAFAADGAEAVRAFAAAREAGRPFDLVLFDLTVPGGMGGKEALQELLKLDPAVRAIASSGYSSDPIMANPRAFGFRASLPKPYDIPDLMRVLEDVRRH